MIKMQEILALSVDERILMIEKIWNSIDHNATQLPSSHIQELDARSARFEKGETTFFSWADIKNELNAAQ